MEIESHQVINIYNEIIRHTFWFAIILVLLDIYALFFVENMYLRDLLNFASEKTPATWLSSTLLLLIGVSLFILYSLKKNKRWLFAGYFFLYLSLDDAAYMHEQISSWINTKSEFINFLPGYGWLYTIAPFLIVGILIIFYYIYIELKKQKLDSKYIFIATILLVLAICFDFIDGIYQETIHSYKAIHFLRVTEELVEIAAFAFILHSVAQLLINDNIDKLKE